MKYIYSIIVLTHLFLCNSNAQVTVGSTQSPEEFSILQLEDAKGGLRFPRLDNTGRAALDIAGASTEAPGLIFYNSEEKIFNYRNDSKWEELTKSINASVGAKNGLSVNAAGKVEFGGTGSALVNPVNLNIVGFKLDLSVGNSGKVTIADKNTLAITANGVGIGTDNPTAALDIRSSTQGGGLQMEDSSIASGVDGYLLTPDDEGKGTLSPLRPMALIRGKIYNPSGDSNFEITAAGVPISTTPMILPPGKWLITAKITVTRKGGSDSTRDKFYTYITLRDVSPVSPKGALVSIGASNEKSGSGMATPQIAYYLSNDKEMHLRLDSSSSDNRTRLTGSFGGGYFHAVRLDKIEK